jgi:phage N-6-adenine-methyltransferase
MGEKFTFDLAADASNAKAPLFFTEKDDALSRPWPTGGLNWLNPPFSNIRPWALKCREEFQYRGVRTVMLVPASVGSEWFRLVFRSARVIALIGRIPFDPERPKWGYPKDCILCLYGDLRRWGRLCGPDEDFSVWDWRKP